MIQNFDVLDFLLSSPLLCSLPYLRSGICKNHKRIDVALSLNAYLHYLCDMNHGHDVNFLVLFPVIFPKVALMVRVTLAVESEGRYMNL